MIGLDFAPQEIAVHLGVDKGRIVEHLNTPGLRNYDAHLTETQAMNEGFAA